MKYTEEQKRILKFLGYESFTRDMKQPKIKDGFVVLESSINIERGSNCKVNKP